MIPKFIQQFTPLLFAWILMLMACDDKHDRGVCSACCDEFNQYYCQLDYTLEMCNKLNEDHQDSLVWSFSEAAEKCPFPDPVLPD